MTVHGAAKGNGLAPLTVTTLFGVSPSSRWELTVFVWPRVVCFCRDGLVFHLG